MRHGLLSAVFAGLLAAAGCSGSQALDEVPLAAVNRCIQQSHNAPRFLIVEPYFVELQASLAAGDEPTGRAAELQQLLESQVFFDTFDVTFDPALWDHAYIPGESTLEELVYQTGFRSVDDFVDAAFLGLRFIDEDIEIPEGVLFELELEFECQSFDMAAIEEQCERRNRDPMAKACRDLPRIPNRNAEFIASVCDELPYFLVCQPENPPPMTYEEATGQPEPE